MQYEIVTLPSRKIVAMSIRTGNQDPACSAKIGKLWDDFFCSGRCQALGVSPDAPCYGVYTNHHLDDNSYDALVGCESSRCPEGFVEVELPTGDYAKFSLHGHVRQAVVEAWKQILDIPLPRAYTADFEVYRNCNEDLVADIDIYVALADICQSCGMPMTTAAHHGTERDGGISREYCCYCRQDGAFMQECTMEQMVEACLDLGPQLYTDRAQAKKEMMAYFPTLKRWQNA